jgi:CubicO group peptidase (beta-lactamase class C family)
MEPAIQSFLNTCIAQRSFPGCTLGLIRHGSKQVYAAGRLTYDHASSPVIHTTMYDIASLTKAIPTASLALQLVEQGVLSLNSRVVDLLPECTGRYFDRVTLHHLFTHTLDFGFSLSGKKNLRPGEIIDAIVTADLKQPPGATYCYANATSILLGLLVERTAGRRLDILAQERFFSPLGMTATTFFPETLDRTLIAPTEIDPWRGREIRGEVHDESAWALRPEVIAGSAGLYSTAPDLLQFLEMLLSRGELYGKRYFNPDTLDLIHTNALPPELGAVTALGWELDQERFMGKNRTASTFGKTGFTGCTIIADPLRRTGFVLLCNHTWPQRRQDREAINRVRQGLADLIFSP